MVALRHTAKRGHAFALAASGDDHRLFVRIIFNLFNINERIVRDAQIPQAGGSVNDIHHASALHHHLPPKFISGIDNLPHPVHIGRKGCNEDPGIFVLFKQSIEYFAHCAL